MSEMWRDVNGHVLEIDPIFVTDGGNDRKWLFGFVTCPTTCAGWERAFHENGMTTVVLEEDEYLEGRTHGWWRVSPVSTKGAPVL